MTQSAYYQSLGVFFNGADAEVYLNLLKQKKLPVKVDLLSLEDKPDEFFGMEIFTKKSAVEPALQIKKELIEKTLENPDVYLHQISDEDLLAIPYHPEDANDFDYWAALELIRRKGLPLEERDWEAYRQEKLIERFEKSLPKSSGLFYAGLAIIVLGLLMLIITYRTMPVINILFFTGSLIVGRKMAKGDELIEESEKQKGRLLVYLSGVLIGISLYLTYKYML